MSIVNGDNIIIGQFADDTKNIRIKANSDGTVVLARKSDGSGDQLMTISASGVVSFPANTQTLQNVIGSRVAGTPYVNNTALPITVMVSMSSSGNVSTIVASSDSKDLFGSTAAVAGYQSSVTFRVMPGKSYSVAMNGGTSTIGSWLEER